MGPRTVALLVVVLTICSVTAFNAHSRFISASRKAAIAVETSSQLGLRHTPCWMSMLADVAADFSSYKIGQEYEGKVVSVKQFGAFVNISTSTNVLLPRSLLTRGSFEKLKSMAESSSKDSVRLELVGVSAENQTLSGKYIPANYKTRSDLSTLVGKDLNSKTFPSTVVSSHDFGVFVELDEFGVEGLIPASRIRSSKGPKGFTAGSPLEVMIESMNIDEKKLVLKLKDSPQSSGQGGGDSSALESLPKDKWFQAIVQNVANFGLFVRPAGFDAVALVHNRRIPRDLIAALKKQVTIDGSNNQTDIEALFSEGDVIKVRVHAAADPEAARKLELSMLPNMGNDDEDSDYVPDYMIDAEGNEMRSNFDRDDDEEDTSYDAESTLLWWKGKPYVKIGRGADAGSVDDEEVAVLAENTAIVEGAWRRMFEVDLREDAADFSSKALEMELKELEEEIGELGGLDEDMIDAPGFGSVFRSTAKFGSFIPTSSLPEEWKNELEFLKESDETDSSANALLRGGKKVEQSEFEALLKEVEVELEQASLRQGAGAAKRETVVTPTPAEETPAPVAEGAVPAEE